MESAIDEADAERLHQLLSVEKQLEELVRAAQEEAARRIAAARAGREERLAAAREAAAQTDLERARAERAAHERDLGEIAAAHQSALAAIASLPDARVDELARWALLQAITDTGDLP